MEIPRFDETNYLAKVTPRMVLLKAVSNRKFTIAIVDDDEAVVNHLMDFFFTNNCDAMGFNSGQSALTYLYRNIGIKGLGARCPFDLLIVDQYMPELDGLSFTKEAHELFPALAIVLISAFGSIDSAVTAIKNGAVDFIEKPYSENTLKKVLEVYGMGVRF